MSSQEEAGTVVEIDYVYLTKEESNSTIQDDNSSLISTSTPLRQSPPEKCTSFCKRVLEERNISDRSKFHRPCNLFQKIFSNREAQKQHAYSYEKVKSSKSSNENIFTKILRGIKEHLFAKMFRGVKRSMSKLLRH